MLLENVVRCYSQSDTNYALRGVDIVYSASKQRTTKIWLYENLTMVCFYHLWLLESLNQFNMFWGFIRNHLLCIMASDRLGYSND